MLQRCYKMAEYLTQNQGTNCIESNGDQVILYSKIR